MINPNSAPHSLAQPTSIGAPRHTRRRLLGAALTGGALAGGALVAAPGSLAAQATPGAGTPVAGGWPRTLTDAVGPVTIPAPPTRVVAASDWYELDFLLAIDVAPVLYGFTDRYGLGVAPWLTDLGEADLARYEFAEEPDLELIAAAQPDLIITDPYLGEATYDLLQAIAPTVALPTPYTGETDWRVTQRLVGAATGREDAATAAIAATEAVIAAGRATLAPVADRTVTIGYASEYNGGSLFFPGADSQEARLIAALGLTYVAKGDDDGPQSLETLNRLADVDILLSYDIFGAAAIIEAAPGFTALPAVAAGRYVPLSALTARAIFAPSTLSLRFAVTELVAAITAAAAGVGKTVPD